MYSGASCRSKGVVTERPSGAAGAHALSQAPLRGPVPASAGRSRASRIGGARRPSPEPWAPSARARVRGSVPASGGRLRAPRMRGPYAPPRAPGPLPGGPGPVPRGPGSGARFRRPRALSGPPATVEMTAYSLDGGG